MAREGKRFIFLQISLSSSLLFLFTSSLQQTVKHRSICAMLELPPSGFLFSRCYGLARGVRALVNPTKLTFMMAAEFLPDTGKILFSLSFSFSAQCAASFAQEFSYPLAHLRALLRTRYVPFYEAALSFYRAKAPSSSAF